MLSDSKYVCEVLVYYLKLLLQLLCPKAFLFYTQHKLGWQALSIHLYCLRL